LLITVSDNGLKKPNLQMEKAIEVILNGGTVIVGTETYYAIAANPFLGKAVERIFSIKRRSSESPLPLIAASQEFVNSRTFNVPQIARTLMKTFWPGSLTILLDAEKEFSGHVRNEFGKIGVRVPPDCPARRLAAEVGGWITATSANLSGGAAPKTVDDIPIDLIDSVDVVLDSGPCPGGRPSTVIDVSDETWSMIRVGSISEESISFEITLTETAHHP
jgi:L-threonylcarbamoyladenylate synthase